MVESGLLQITKVAPITSITKEIPRVLVALCQELGTETKYIFLMPHYQIQEMLQ